MDSHTARRTDLQVAVAFSDERTEVIAHGEVDVATAPALRGALGEAEMRHLDDGVNGPIAVDLSGVTFIDSTGLGVLLGSARRGRRAGHEVVLRNPVPTVLRVLEITGLLRVFRLERDSHGAPEVRPRAAALA